MLGISRSFRKQGGERIMLESVSYLHIKPIVAYKSGENHPTKLTKTDFQDVLKKEEEAQETESREEVTQKDASAEKSETVYKDPVTGKEVVYIDVAEKKDSVEKSSSSSNTTSADAMKKTKYDEYFKKAAKVYGVSESLLKAIAKAESNFNPNDVSSAGAIGIMQLMPGTAKELGVSNPYDPEQNIMGGAKCIAQKLKEFNGDVRLALAAYNAGSGAVKRNGGVPSYCKSYVSKVLSYKEAYEIAEAVG
ncbi:lytic transglycosylase domain-containing protein [bacterium D16-51]|nr:lytic transglycosylase domain-containing protein [bacterium D16-59]RKI57972.1 lytic transglycosylase domain-containing protein [bacterium D16-51]